MTAFNSTLSAGLGFTGSVKKRPGRSLAASVQPIGTAAKRASRPLAASIQPVGTAAKRTARKLAAAAGFTGAIATSRRYFRSLSAGLSFTGSQSRAKSRVFPTAVATAHANLLGLSATDGFIALAWPTTSVQALAFAPGIGTLVGDDFYAPAPLSGASGSYAADLTPFTVQATEPGLAGATQTAWLRRWPAEAGALRITPITPSSAVALEVWDGNNLADLQQRLDVDGNPVGTASLVSALPDIDLTATTRIRLLASTSTSVNFAWAFISDAVGTLDLELSTPTVAQTPAVLRASVLGALAGETVRFQVVGVTFTQDLVTDTSGVLSSVGIQLVAGISAGSHVLRATGLTSGRVGEVTFSVSNSQLYPTPPAADTAPTPVTQTGVRRWVLQDPMSGGLTQYQFVTNPKAMSDPFPPKYVTPEHTTAPNGQFIMWQGAKRATPWKFAGRIVTQAEHDALALWSDCRRRVYVMDHRNRAFLCHIETIELSPDEKPNEPWGHLYEARLQVYGWSQL